MNLEDKIRDLEATVAALTAIIQADKRLPIDPNQRHIDARNERQAAQSSDPKVAAPFADYPSGQRYGKGHA